MAPIRVYFPSISEVWTCNYKTGENGQDIFRDCPKWESLIENASETYAKANDQCKLYIAKGIIEEMQVKNPVGRFYQFRRDSSWHCLSPKEALEMTQEALINMHANRKQKPELRDIVSSKTAPRIPTAAQVENKTTSPDVGIMERLRKKFVSILRVVLNSSLSQADQNTQIKAIAEEAIEYVKAAEEDWQDVDMADYDSDVDSPAPPRRNKQPRLPPEEYFGGDVSVCASEMASGGTIATKLLDNGLMAGVAKFEPHSSMAACKIVRNMKIKDDRWYTGSILYGRPHGIGFMKYKDGRIICGNWLSGVSHGQILAIYKNGDAYIGGCLKNKRNGVGLYHYNDGSKYDGVFLNDDRHGRGAFTTKDGHVFDGTFVRGDFEGNGVARYANGSVVRGHFENWVHIE